MLYLRCFIMWESRLSYSSEENTQLAMCLSNFTTALFFTTMKLKFFPSLAFAYPNWSESPESMSIFV